MRELNVCEIEEVNGGLSASDAAVGYGSAIAAGALIGLMTGDPGGMLIGAVMGASRVAISGGIAIITLSYMGHIKQHD
ncbi:MAG: Blp family class II bacteriocin [Aliivibrio sp.]|uniref:Blp family class II bacteriocin n=1 Tax=Aliivibrio sp. TaxID=1872443 RepID=UPI001A446551|nr:Blp family class II bacteriocin [Aliivibrio sp.]